VVSPFQSFRLKLVHLVDGLLDLLEEDPLFVHFMLDGQTIVLDDYLAMRPEKKPSCANTSRKAGSLSALGISCRICSCWTRIAHPQPAAG